VTRGAPPDRSARLGKRPCPRRSQSTSRCIRQQASATRSKSGQSSWGDRIGSLWRCGRHFRACLRCSMKSWRGLRETGGHNGSATLPRRSTQATRSTLRIGQGSLTLRSASATAR
jgi:hypothetical protein